MLTKNETTMAGPLAVPGFDDPPGDPAGGTPPGAPAAGGADPGNGGGDGGGAAGGGAGTGGQPASGASTETYTIKVAGQEVKLTRDEALRLASQGHDYTRKTQALARDRETFYAERRRWEEARDAAMRRQAPQPEGDPNDQNAARMAQIEQQIQDEKLDRTLNDLEKKHGEHFDRDLFLAEAARRGVSKWEDLIPLADEHAQALQSRRDGLLDKFLADPENPRMKAFRQKIIDEYVASKTKPGGKTVSKAPGQAPGGGGPPKPPATDEERHELAMTILGRLNE